MRERSLQKLIRTVAWALWVLAWAFAVLQLTGTEGFLDDSIGSRLILAGTALLCMRVWRRGAPSIATAALIPLLVVWPDPRSLALGLGVLAGGHLGRSRRRERRHPIYALSSTSVAWCLSYGLLASDMLPPLSQPEVWSAVRAGLGWGVFEGVSWALALPLAAMGRSPRSTSGRPVWINPILAWLYSVLAAFGWIALLVVPATIAVQHTLVRLARTQRGLRRIKRDLEARTAELLTLHAVGQELLARADNTSLGPLLDRECRKLFDPEGFSLVLAEDGGMRSVYRREGERLQTRPEPLGDGLTRWLLDEKRGLCWIHDEDEPDHAPPMPHARSAMIAPLLVEERVAGALIVESVKKKRFDDHQLAVLTTVAQQAAAALESAQQQERATIDSLTGFFVREHFFQRLEEEHRRAKRYAGGFALLMIDLDDFKMVNDRHGHLAGDRYLRSAALAIRAQLRGADMPCRYGGDEFALLLPETDLGGALAIAERIREAVAGLEVEAEGARLRGTVSIGLAGFPDHGSDDAKDLMRHADEALYRAKRAGRNRVISKSASDGLTPAATSNDFL